MEKAAKDFTQTQVWQLSFLSAISVLQAARSGKQEALKEMPRRGRADVLTTPSLSHSLASRSFTTKRHRAFPWEHRGPNMPSYNTLHMCTHVCNTHTNTHTGTVLWGQGGALVSRPPFLLRLSSSFRVKGG